MAHLRVTLAILLAGLSKGRETLDMMHVYQTNSLMINIYSKCSGRGWVCSSRIMDHWIMGMGDHCERVQLQVEGGCTTRVGQCLGLLGAGAGLGSCAAPPFRATRSSIQQIQLYHLFPPLPLSSITSLA